MRKIEIAKKPVNGNGDDGKRGHVGRNTWKCLHKPDISISMKMITKHKIMSRRRKNKKNNTVAINQFSKVSIYRQSIFHIDILTRRRSNKNVFYRCTRGRSNKMCFTGAKKCLFYHFFMECHSIQFTTISINVERGIVKILFKYRYFQDLLIDIDIDIDIDISLILLIDIDIHIDIFQNHHIDIDIDIDIF